MNSAHPGPYAGIPRWLRPITRRPGEVQFGVLEGGPIVTGVTPDEARLLARLDGSLPPDAIGEVASASGVSKRRWRMLLDLVMRLGLLEVGSPRSPGGPSSDERAAQRAAQVLVEGEGVLAHDLARLLAHDPAGAADGQESGASEPGAVVIVADLALDPRQGDAWLLRGVPHLPVVTTGDRTVVGPLVDGLPGSPCLWCLDLHRSDRDDAWPTIMAQVASVPLGVVPSPRVADGAGRAAGAGEPGLPHLVAGVVGALVARSMAGDRPPAGVAVEVSLPWPRLDHRRWRPHPRCERHAFRAGMRAGSSAPFGGAGVA